MITIVIAIPADPGVPQDVFAIQIEHIEDSCIVTASWEDLMDSEAGIQNYNIYANQTDVSNDAVISGRTSDNHRISSLLLVPGCFVHEISVSAVNICGHEGPRSAVYRLNPDMRFVIPGSPSATDRPCDSGGKVNTGK